MFVQEVAIKVISKDKCKKDEDLKRVFDIGCSVAVYDDDPTAPRRD